MPDASIRSFAYRHPRFATNLAMDFVVGERVIPGACESISEKGVYVRLADKLQPGIAGMVTLYCGAESSSAHAIVATTAVCADTRADDSPDEQDYAALHFVFHDEEEKEAVRSLLAKLKLRRAG